MKKKIAIPAIAGAVLLAVVGVSLTASAVTPPTTGSGADYYLVDSGTGLAVTAGSTLAWNADVSGSPVADNSDFTHGFTGPAGTTSIASFISPRGSETNKAQWNASGSVVIAGSSIVLPAGNWSTFTVANSAQNPGTAAAVKGAGGAYSLGIAFFQGTTIIGADFAFIDVTPTTGAYTFATPTGVVVPPAAGTTFTSNLTAQAIAAADGTLSLVAPANLNVAIGNPVLTNGTYGLSVSTGQLGQFSVVDNRYVTHKGWTLTTSVADFTGPIGVSKVQLGVKPVLVASGTTTAGITTGNEQFAGAATYPSTFASASNAPTVGTTNFNADLKFIAPANAPAGNYVSTLTLTVVGAP